MGSAGRSSTATIHRGKRLGVGVLIGAVTASAALLPAVAVAAPVSVPVITSPTDGDSVASATLDVSATSTADEVLFVLDEPGGPFTDRVVVAGTADAVLPTVGLDGMTSLAAYDCDAGGDCNSTGDTLEVDIDLAAPTLTEPRNNAVVGNSFTAKATSSLGPVGFLVDGDLKAVDETSPYAAQISIADKSQGNHSLRAVQCNSTGQVCEGARSAARSIIKDTRGPTWTSVDADPRTFFPANDGYKDSTKLSARVGEDSRSVKVVIRSGGKTVRTITLGREDRGKISASWNGRKRNGDVVDPGRYSFQFTGSDRWGNKSASSRRDVVVSGKRLERRVATKTVTALGSGFADISGRCGGVYRLTYEQARFDWPRGVGYYSKSKCNGSRAEDVAAAAHRIGLPNAVRYGSIKVDTYGAGAFRHSGPGAILYVKANGNFGAARKVSSSLGWHGGPKASLSKYVYRGGFRWVFATVGGSWYDVKEFRLTYSYYVLR